jgi:hypothetical protein
MDKKEFEDVFKNLLNKENSKTNKEYEIVIETYLKTYNAYLLSLSNNN